VFRRPHAALPARRKPRRVEELPQEFPHARPSGLSPRMDGPPRPSGANACTPLTAPKGRRLPGEQGRQDQIPSLGQLGSHGKSI
jgi:hypothetical protein